MDVQTYFAQRRRDIERMSLAPDRPFEDMVFEEEGSGGKRGRIFGNLTLSDRAFLSIHEVVRVVGSHITREAYAYYLVIDGDEIWGEERDPTHSPAVHSHGQGHTTRSTPARPVSFKEAVARAWADVSERETV